MVCPLGAQIKNYDFVETGFIGLNDFIVVRYSATDSGLPSNSRFVTMVT
jgi:hypothetical protein